MSEPRAGAVAPAVADELPGLTLRWIEVDAAAGPSPAALRGRLAGLSDRRRGIDAVALRTRPVPRAYRACFRQLGVDPDVERIPAERVAVAQLLDGGLRSRDRIADACVIAVVETGVGVWALDSAAVDADGPGIRVARPDEPGAGGLVVADRLTVHAPLFGEPLPGSAPGPRTRAVVAFAVGAPGVAEAHVREALWLAEAALRA